MTAEEPVDDPAGAPCEWRPEHPERVDDPAVRRSPVDRALVAAIKLLTRRRSFEVFRMIAVRRGLLRPFMSYNARLMPFGKLGRRRTEMVILRAAVVCRSEYEWTQHVPIARRAGVTPAEIAAIADADLDRLPPQDAVLLGAVEELLADHAIADETYVALGEFLDPARILELCLLVGHYVGLAGALNTFGVPLEPALRRDAR